MCLETSPVWLCSTCNLAEKLHIPVQWKRLRNAQLQIFFYIATRATNGEREVKCTSEVHALPFNSIFLHLLVFILSSVRSFSKNLNDLLSVLLQAVTMMSNKIKTLNLKGSLQMKNQKVETFLQHMSSSSTFC